MKKLKQLAKIAGNLLMLAALAFLVHKFMKMDVDIAKLMQPRILCGLALAALTLTAVVVCNTYPWLAFTQSLSGTKIPFRRAMPIFTRSNLYKYVPGNVFQYIGRNQLAADMHISHVDVACATILDILFGVLSTGVISLLLLGGAIGEVLQEYGKNFLLIGGIGIAAAVFAAMLVFWKFRDKCQSYLLRYRSACSKENRPLLLRGILYYFLQNIVSAVVYGTVLLLIFQASGKAIPLDQIFTLTGAFLFAWIVGFITPGAPGGIGIRESVMLFLCRNADWEAEILLYVLVLRIASILADVLGFLIGMLCGMGKGTQECTDE